MKSFELYIKYLMFFAVPLLVLGCSSSGDTTKNEQTTDSLSVKIDRQQLAMNHFLDGMAAESKGDFSMAIIEFQEALQYDPQPGIYYQLAKNYFYLQKLSLALQNSKKSVELDSTNLDYLNLLQEIYKSAKQYDSAILTLERIISLDSSSVNAYYDLARLYETKRPLKAIEIYEKLLDLIGNEWSVLIRISELYERLGNTTQAINHMTSLLELDPSNVPLKKLIAEFYIKDKQYDKASDILNDVILSFPEDIDAREKRAHLFVIQKEWKKASEEYRYLLTRSDVPHDIKIRIAAAFFEESVQDTLLLPYAETLFNTLNEDSTDWMTKMYLGVIAFRKGETEKAINHFDKVTELAPWNPEAWIRLGGLLFDIKRYNETIEVLKRGVEKFPEDFTINLILGISYSQLDNYGSAKPYLAKAVELDPNDVNALSSYGYTLSRLKDTPGAIKYLNAALRVQPENVDLLGTLGLIYDGEEDWANCDSVYLLALSIDSSNALVLNNYAYSLSKRGENLGLALEMITKALEAEPDNSSYLDTYGWVCYKMGNYEKAREYIYKSLKIGGDKSVILDHLGDVYFKMGNRQKAIEYWKKALELEADNISIKSKIEKGEI